jgi:hypothetical protein
LYDKLLRQRPELPSHELAEAIGKSFLSPETKRSLFDSGSRHKDLEHRRAALRQLRDIDHNLFVEKLVQSLQALPAEALATSSLKPGEKWLAALVTQTADPRAWKALEKVARRSGVALRVEYLENAGLVEDAEKEVCRKERLAFLAAFLEDTAVRDVARHVTWVRFFAAGSDFSRLEVRNFAAMWIAGMLKLPEEAKPDWGEAQWARLRGKVREELRRAR